MKKLLQKLLRKPVIRLVDKFSSRPDKERVFNALEELYRKIEEGKEKKGLIIPFEANIQKFIVFSDQHKGAKNHADDFAVCENNYLAALQYYFDEGFYFINLGDGEELWENNIASVKKNNQLSFEKEKLFLQQNRFIKIFGNHDLDWGNDPAAPFLLQSIYGQKISIYEGCLLTTTIGDRPFQVYLTHGHQGDMQSDGNWFSKFFVAKIWGPLQSFLDINPNTPATNNQLKSLHNTIMYEWSSARKNLLLITGHTHQPVFMALTHLERLYLKLNDARRKNDADAVKKIEEEMFHHKLEGGAIFDFTALIPSYFNSGCCCYDDGDITGIEIAEGKIRLIRWKYQQKMPVREVLEEISLSDLEKLLP
jgi:UDP-2,3-diacylglucosamine pyrophosphatase LpxH